MYTYKTWSVSLLYMTYVILVELIFSYPHESGSSHETL